MRKLDKTVTSKTTRNYSRGRLPDGSANPVDCYVGQRLHLLRQLLGISQEKLAELAGLTFQQIQKYENGRNRIGASRLWDLCKILGVDANYFFQDMSPNIAKQSPRMFSGQNQDKCDNTPLPTSPEVTTEAQELLVNYFKIPNRELAKQLFELIKNLSKGYAYRYDEKCSDFKGLE